MALNYDAVNSDRTRQADEKYTLHQYNFLACSRKTDPLACRSEDWIKNSNAKQSHTSAGGQSDSPNIFFKN